MSQASLGDMFHLASPDFVASNQKRPPACGNTRGDESDPGKCQAIESAQKLSYQLAMGKRRTYYDAINHCPPTGSGERLVHRWVLSTANFAFREGVGLGFWAADVIVNATRRVTADELIDAWEKASGQRPNVALKGGVPQSTAAPQAGAEFIQRGAGATADDFRRVSPVQLDWQGNWPEQACALFRALFFPDELVFAGWDSNTPGVLGQSIRTRL